MNQSVAVADSASRLSVFSVKSKIPVLVLLATVPAAALRIKSFLFMGADYITAGNTLPFSTAKLSL